MIRPQLVLDLNEKIFIDYFACGGGASTAYEQATGRHVDIAVNHDRKALAMHRANHPQTKHYPEDVWKFNILKAINGRKVGGCWFSPDCRHFSKAKGGALVSRKVRGLGWMLTKQAGIGGPRLRDGGPGPACPDVMYLENVEEFVTWGPLICKRDSATGRCIKIDGTVAARGEVVPLKEQWLIPDPKRKGIYFKKLERDLRKRGATAFEYRIEKACDHGAPTIRRRLELVVRFDGKPIVWSEGGYAAPDSEAVKTGRKKPYHIAAECLDFSIPCYSVLMTAQEAKKLGLKRPLAPASNRRIALGTERYVMNAAEPFLVCLTHQGGDRIEPVHSPLNVVTGAHRGEKAFVAPLVAFQQHGGAVRPVTVPVHTIAASKKDQNQVLAIHLARQFKTTIGQPVDDPLFSVMPQGGGGKSLLIASSLARDFGQSIGQPVDKSMPATMGDGAGKTRLLAAFLAQNNGGFNTTPAHDVRAPLSTATGTGSQQSLVVVSLLKYYGTPQDPHIEEPLDTVTTKDRFALSLAELGIPPLTPELAERARKVAAYLRENGVEFEGEFATCCGLVIYDICMRMLVPRELYRAQGFPPDYIIEWGIEEDGTIICLSKTDQIHMVGNSVPPPMARDLIRDNSPELAVWYKGDRERLEALEAVA